MAFKIESVPVQVFLKQPLSPFLFIYLYSVQVFGYFGENLSWTSYKNLRNTALQFIHSKTGQGCIKIEENKVTRMDIKSIGREVVHAKVGKDLQDFGIHKSLICHCSPFFKAAFTSGFEETTTGIIKLSYVDVEVFELFFSWLYTREISRTEPETARLATSDDELKLDHESKLHVSTLLRLYIFADMIQVPTLKNECIEELFCMDVFEKGYLTASENVQHVWEHTREDDLIRKFLVDIIVWDLEKTSFHKTMDQLPEEVRIAVLLAMKMVIDNARTESKGTGKRKGRSKKTLVSLVSPLDDSSNYYEDSGGEENANGDNRPGSMTEVSDQEMYEVEEILDSKVVHGVVSYRAKWFGYPPNKKYYSAENFTGAQELVDKFHKKYPHKPHPDFEYD